VCMGMMLLAISTSCQTIYMKREQELFSIRTLFLSSQMNFPQINEMAFQQQKQKRKIACSFNWAGRVQERVRACCCSQPSPSLVAVVAFHSYGESFL